MKKPTKKARKATYEYDAYRSQITGRIIFETPSDLRKWDKIRVREILPRKRAKAKRGRPCR